MGDCGGNAADARGAGGDEVKKAASHKEVYDGLTNRALALETQAIDLAEKALDYADWPRRELAKIAHAELKLKAAAALRERAKVYLESPLDLKP